MTWKNRKLSDDQVRQLRAWWVERERVYAAYLKIPNPREMGIAMGISQSSVVKAGMGYCYKEVK